jgi:hypothetical protein
MVFGRWRSLMVSRIEKLGEIPDPRRGSARRHALPAILTIS